MRNTNSILIQENTLLKDTGRKGIVLQPDYDFDRKTHHSYKGATTTLDTINDTFMDWFPEANLKTQKQ